ncbi:MAG TPA: DUF92 domain-containing protein [Anaerolineaceae bacterium]|nr:DUF92 domain-containing protein [Anaerolineaceae bacterium]HOQ68831.1 DUF92 domain-containing protein [Anaerolineaceae bacterium]HOS53031.1 DUF92 domain-containing protein [Anaerolineaceae bacterium]HPD62018.1 DUF92 domain-containing protein [Anaerolineaceae bacterium]HQF68452.1 DUF92 domain-containing protein [Anaerolineaceae bacterium]
MGVPLSPIQLIFGVLLAALVVYAAYRARSLDRSGALAAFLLGVVVFGIGGFCWALVLLTFFITSSGLSHLFRVKKQKVEEQAVKGGRRDAWQVGANGGVAGLAALLSLVMPGSVLPWLAFAAAFAAANADTWATELGVLNRSWPRRLTDWKRVPPGTSGAVSLAGTLAATGGALLVALMAAACWPVVNTSFREKLVWGLVILLAGVFGSLVDSLLGATLQVIYWCPACEKETEKHPLHSCGKPTRRVRGWGWLNNDVVNLACTLSAALLACLLGLLLR